MPAQSAPSNLSFRLTPHVPCIHGTEKTEKSESPDDHHKANIFKSKLLVRTFPRRPATAKYFDKFNQSILVHQHSVNFRCTCDNFDLDSGTFDVLFCNNRSHYDT